MSTHIANDKKFGRKVYRYHPRSDEHSKFLCKLVLADLIAACPLLAKHIQQGEVISGINVGFTFPNGKTKTLDLAIGPPKNPVLGVQTGSSLQDNALAKVRIACEAKQTMTEHSKSKPRLFDELSSSHEIVHQGDNTAIAAGIVVINVANTFASPTRQVSPDGPPVFIKHRQPEVTRQMVEHLRGLIVRNDIGQVGFDAFTTIVVDCDNVGLCRLHTDVPAPQPGSSDHYETFLARISQAYVARYG